jgi:hypothetical protein
MSNVMKMAKKKDKSDFLMLDKIRLNQDLVLGQASTIFMAINVWPEAAFHGCESLHCSECEHNSRTLGLVRFSPRYMQMTAPEKGMFRMSSIRLANVCYDPYEAVRQRFNNFDAHEFVNPQKLILELTLQSTHRITVEGTYTGKIPAGHLYGEKFTFETTFMAEG